MEALIGLAEYTNANFFSEDRIFTENDVDPPKRFPYPNRASVTEQDFDVSVRGSTVKRRYFVKTADGATGYRLATVGLLRDYQQRFNLDWTRFRESPALDEAVYRDYAQRLVPRAVAYSTALLDYFFRGLVVASGNDLSFGSGTAATRQWTGPSPCTTTTAATHAIPCRGRSGQGALHHRSSSEDLTLVAPSNPPAKKPGRYMLVFRGGLGSEPDAVVGRQVFLEPMMVARLVKRSDGTPHRASCRPGDRRAERTGPQLGCDRSGWAGSLVWKPGRTILFIPAINSFPMYWAGASMFSSSIEGGRIVQAADLDAPATGDHPDSADPGRVAGANRVVHGAAALCSFAEWLLPANAFAR